MSRLILDTGPLLDLLLYRFWSEQGRSIDENRLECRKQFNVSPKQISQFLGRHQGIIVVPGVFVEVGRLAQVELGRTAGQPREFSLGPFWRVATRELRQMSVEERWISFLSLDQTLLEGFGPTDAALIRCAQETGEERVPILTHDQPLHGRCRRQQISCILPSEILQRLYS
ncbi:MAG: hypothetical protein FJ147_22560 [Deltaproteobacteria bacterium]|nr:hypothetical protein [Deltaproteobacteria bacterium]